MKSRLKVFLAFGITVFSCRSIAEAEEVCYAEIGPSTCWPMHPLPPPSSVACAGTCDSQKKCNPADQFLWMNDNTTAEWVQTEPTEGSGHPSTSFEIIICWTKHKCKCENGTPGDNCVADNKPWQSDTNIDRTLDQGEDCGDPGGGQGGQ